MKWPDKTLQNLPYFIIYPKLFFRFFQFVQIIIIFPFMALVYVEIGKVVHYRQSKKNVVFMKWKKEKQLRVFVYIIKYEKFWSVFPGDFIKYKHLISDEWGSNHAITLTNRYFYCNIFIELLVHYLHYF